MDSVMVSWMRGCCRTQDMIYLSLPRSTSDMGLKEKGKTRKNTCTVTVGVLIFTELVLYTLSGKHRAYEYKKKSTPL